MYLGDLNMAALSFIYLGDRTALVDRPVFSAFHVPDGDTTLPISCYLLISWIGLPLS
jgi:hypothetical protein